jgi:amidase
MFIKQKNRIPWNTAYMLASLSTDVMVSQAVNPLKTVRVRIPKSLLK